MLNQIKNIWYWIFWFKIIALSLLFLKPVFSTRHFLSKVIKTFGHFSIKILLGIFAVVKILEGTLIFSLLFRSVFKIDFFVTFWRLIKYWFILYFFEYRFPTQTELWNWWKREHWGSARVRCRQNLECRQLTRGRFFVISDFVWTSFMNCP